jgi:hypothetical protein
MIVQTYNKEEEKINKDSKKWFGMKSSNIWTQDM